MYKWLTITFIVCLGFIVVLLSLGYLLKENEIAVTALKKQLDEQQSKTTKPNSPKAVLTFVDKEPTELDKLKQYTNIITKNVTCTSTSQCVLINTNINALGCIVSVNTIGAALLTKALKQESKRKECEYLDTNLIKRCEQNICQVTAL